MPAGRYVALLSFDDLDARDHLMESSFALSDTTPIAHSKAELFGGNLLAQIVIDDQGVGRNAMVWTGSAVDGTKVANDNCGNWTTTSDQGFVGVTTNSSAGWIFTAQQGCDQSLRVYCVQQSVAPPTT